MHINVKYFFSKHSVSFISFLTNQQFVIVTDLKPILIQLSQFIAKTIQKY